MPGVTVRFKGLAFQVEGTREQCDAVMKQALEMIGGITKAALPAPTEPKRKPRRPKKQETGE